MLTAVVITRNAEPSIKRCLKSLSFANEIIVVDSGSTDQTVAIAAQCGASVHFRPWSGYGAQKNHGASLAQHDWLLFIDADEEVPSALAQAITNILHNQPPSTPHDYYWLRIVTVFLGKPLTHLYGHNPRLFKKNLGHWNDAPVHEQVVTSYGQVIRLDDNLSGKITSPLLHHSHATVRSYLDKMRHYTTLDAKQMFLSGHHRSGRYYRPSLWLPYHLFLRQLFKLLFYRRGVLDGVHGCLWCLLSAYYEYDMAKKYLDRLGTGKNSSLDSTSLK